MSGVEQTVRQLIEEVPLIFRSRTDVLHHVLCVLGNGFRWEDGEPVCDRSLPAWTPERQDADLQKCAQGSPEVLAALRQGWAPSMAECVEVLQTIDERVHTYGDLRGGQFYPQSGHVLLMNVPDDVTAEWAAACADMWALALQHGWAPKDAFAVEQS